MDETQVQDFFSLKEKLEASVGSKWDFKTFKGVFLEILKIINDPKAGARDLSRVISRDPGLSSRTLRIVNSPYYGLRSKVSNLTQAAALLGFEMMKRIALSTSVFEAFPFRSREYLVLLWRNSLAAARICEILAAPQGPIAGEAYTVGLLHHVGKILICSLAPDKYRRIEELQDNSGYDDLKAESEILGLNHAEIGFVVATLWDLPLVTRQAIGQHHTELIGTKLSQEQFLAQIVFLADEVCDYLGLGWKRNRRPGEKHSIQERVPRLVRESLNLEADFMNGILERFVDLSKEIEELMRLMAD